MCWGWDGVQSAFGVSKEGFAPQTPFLGCRDAAAAPGSPPETRGQLKG